MPHDASPRILRNFVFADEERTHCHFVARDFHIEAVLDALIPFSCLGTHEERTSGQSNKDHLGVTMAIFSETSRISAKVLELQNQINLISNHPRRQY